MNELTEIINMIIKECYWDYNFLPKDILNIINSNNIRLKQKLFEKIINNSTDKLKSLTIFKKEELKDLFNSFSSKYNQNFFKKNIFVLRNILLNENNKIEVLEWKKR